MGKPIIIVYFSPECEDCQQLTEEILNHANDFAKASIAMITYLSMEEVLQFATKYNLDKYSNIYVGTESNTYFVGRYYNVQQLPFIALYNKKGDLIKIYNGKFSLDDLSKQLKNL